MHECAWRPWHDRKSITKFSIIYAWHTASSTNPIALHKLKRGCCEISFCVVKCKIVTQNSNWHSNWQSAAKAVKKFLLYLLLTCNLTVSNSLWTLQSLLSENTFIRFSNIVGIFYILFHIWSLKLSIFDSSWRQVTSLISTTTFAHYRHFRKFIANITSLIWLKSFAVN